MSPGLQGPLGGQVGMERRRCIVTGCRVPSPFLGCPSSSLARPVPVPSPSAEGSAQGLLTFQEKVSLQCPVPGSW